MTLQRSTFDKLVDTLSTEEAQVMLATISNSMKNSASIQTDYAAEPYLDTEHHKILQYADEIFIVRLWLWVRAFFKSIKVEALYESELLRRIGNNLHKNYRDYIDVKKNVFLTDFYELLQALRRTQLFFISLLSAYDINKGMFYLLVSSFAAPHLYSRLIEATAPFDSLKPEDTADTDSRAECLKRIDGILSHITSEHKSDMYLCAHAIEWMKHFCELPLDKALLRFTVTSESQATCPIQTISTELGALASVLSTVKPIPDMVLQALFLLSKQELLNTASSDMEKESVVFISEASHALEAIKLFSVRIPIIEFARYAENSIHWMPQFVKGGEDWFLLFKNAWKKRFNEKWQEWGANQKRAALKKDMLALLKVQDLQALPYRPWEDAWVLLRFKRVFSFNFLYTFFSQFYSVSLQPILNILLLEGNFYRRENLAEFTNAFTVLEKQKNHISTFEKRLSPEGEIGEAFIRYKEKSIPGLKSKTGLETLMKGIEGEAKQIISSSLDSFKALSSLLHGFIEGNKSSIYAPLVNWSTLQGSNNAVFRAKVAEIYKQLEKTAVILTELEMIEKDI